MAHEVRAGDTLKNAIVGRDIIHSLFPALLSRVLRGLLIIFSSVLVIMVTLILITIGDSILRLVVREPRLFSLPNSQYFLPV